MNYPRNYTRSHADEIVERLDDLLSDLNDLNKFGEYRRYHEMAGELETAEESDQSSGQWYTLQKAARLLEIDIKTLRRRLDVLEIEPRESEFDRRKLLISEADLKRVEEASRRNAVKTGNANESQLAELQEEIRQLQRRLEAQERVSRALLTELKRSFRQPARESVEQEESDE